MASYFDQFVIVNIVPGVTNSSLMLLISIIFILVIFRNNNLIPRRWQVVLEILYDHWVNLIKDSLTSRGLKYFPFIISTFF